MRVVSTAITSENNGNGNGHGKVESVVHVLQEELERLNAERDGISERIATIRSVLLRLKNLCSTAASEPSKRKNQVRGLSNVCRHILMRSRDRALTVREVFQAIQLETDGAVCDHKNPRASIATVLGRLVEYGEVQLSPHESGKRAYRWAEHSLDSFGDKP